jgi:hypothetical protein
MASLQVQLILALLLDEPQVRTQRRFGDRLVCRNDREAATDRAVREAIVAALAAGDRGRATASSIRG